MKIQLLPTTFDEHGRATAQQHLCCFVIDDRVALDAGSLAMAASRRQRENIRDVVLSHAHLDHIAGLPLFIDDLFATLREPVKIYAEREVIEVLERDIFNWSIYPNFAELTNDYGKVLEYKPFSRGESFAAAHLQIKPVGVNHKVPSVGFIVSDAAARIAMSGDTAEMNEFWQAVNAEEKIDALLIECAFPNNLHQLSKSSNHLTPKVLRQELEKFAHKNCPVFVINIKSMYLEKVRLELNELNIPNLKLFEVGKIYEF